MEWGLSQITEPATEPVTVAEARSWLRVDGTDEDGTITLLTRAARRTIERRTNRALITSTWRLTLDRFPVPPSVAVPSAGLQLPRGPVTAVTAISYLDTGGASQLLAPTEYVSDLTREPVRIAPAFGKSWPSTRGELAAVKVDFTAGYATADAVPDDLKLALRLLVGHWFENREAVLVGVVSNTLQMAFDELVEPYRLWTFC